MDDPDWGEPEDDEYWDFDPFPMKIYAKSKKASIIRVNNTWQKSKNLM